MAALSRLTDWSSCRLSSFNHRVQTDGLSFHSHSFMDKLTVEMVASWNERPLFPKSQLVTRFTFLLFLSSGGGAITLLSSPYFWICQSALRSLLVSVPTCEKKPPLPDAIQILTDSRFIFAFSLKKWYEENAFCKMTGRCSGIHCIVSWKSAIQFSRRIL